MAGLIIDNLYTGALIAQMVEEGLLSFKDPEMHSPPNKRLVERCLQSMLLFGPALIFRDDEGLEVPVNRLKEFPILEIGPQRPNSFPIWRDSPKPTLKETEGYIEEAKYLRPLIAPYLYQLLKGYLESETLLDKAFGLSFDKLGPQKTRRIVEVLPEVALYHALVNQDEGVDIFELGYSEQAVFLVDGGNVIDETLLPTLLWAINEPKKLISESQQRQLPILSEIIRTPPKAITRPLQEADSVLEVVRITLADAGFELPKIKTVTQLLDLQDDDRLRSLRALAKEVTEGLGRGQLDVISGLQHRIGEASRSLAEVSKFRKRMHWAFAVPVAVGLAEILVGMLPVVSTSMALGLGGGEYALRQKEKRHQWTWLLAVRPPR